MTHALHLSLYPNEGALLRLLGVITRRGFELAALEMSRLSRELHVALTLKGSRPIEPLLRAIEKIYDVRHVELDPPETPWIRVANEAPISTRPGRTR